MVTLKKKNPMTMNKDEREKKVSKTLSRFIPANDNKPPLFRTFLYALMALAGTIVLGLIYFSYPY